MGFLLDNAMRRYKSSITSKGDNSVTGHGDIFILDPPIVENLGSSTMAKKQSIDSVPVPGGGLNYANTLGRVDEDYEQYHVYYLKFIDLLIEREIRARSMEIGNY